MSLPGCSFRFPYDSKVVVMFILLLFFLSGGGLSLGHFCLPLEFFLPSSWRFWDKFMLQLLILLHIIHISFIGMSVCLPIFLYVLTLTPPKLLEGSS